MKQQNKSKTEANAPGIVAGPNSGAYGIDLILLLAAYLVDYS
jgi:hypothetical protein